MDLTRETAYTAVRELKKRLREQFGDTTEVYLFGSVARGDFDAESDIDVLVLIEGEVDWNIKEAVYDVSFSLELEYDVIFGVIVRSKKFWRSSLACAMPIHQNIEQEGDLV